MRAAEGHSCAQTSWAWREEATQRATSSRWTEWSGDAWGSWGWRNTKSTAKGGPSRTSTGNREIQEQPCEEQWQVNTWNPWKMRPQDWSAKDMPVKIVDSIEGLSDSLDENKTQRLVYTTSRPSDAMEALDLLNGDPAAKGVVFLQGNGGLDSATWPKVSKARYEKVAGQLGTRLQPRKGWLWLVGDVTDSKARTCTGTPYVAKPRTDSTVVLRFVAEKKYNEEAWAKLSKGATKCLRDWCLSATPFAAQGCHDTFAFEIIDQKMIKGLMRVDKDKLAYALLAESGACYSRCRWFVEKVGPLCSETSVQWIPSKPDCNETWIQYIDRCRGLAGSKGLVRGRYQLGYRIPNSEFQHADVVSKWVVEGLPKTFLVHDVIDFLSSLHFGAIEVVEKGWRRQGSAWTVRASRNDREELIQGSIMEDGEEYDISIIKAVRRKVDRSVRVPLKSGKVRYGEAMKDRAKDSRGPVAPKGVALPDSAPPAGKSGATPGKSKTEKNANAEHQPSTQGRGAGKDAKEDKDRSRSPKRDANQDEQMSEWTMGGRKVANAADGNCMFYAFATYLTSRGQKKRTHRQLRAWLCSNLRDNLDSCDKRWDKTDHKGMPTSRDFSWYVSELEKPGAWGGHSELQVLCALSLGPRRDGGSKG